MGYTTDFYGKFEITPTLTDEHREYLDAFNKSRRMMRNPSICKKILESAENQENMRQFYTGEYNFDKVGGSDYICLRQIKAGLPIGEDGEYFLGLGALGQVQDSSVIDHNSPPKTQPGLWCGWIPNERGDAIIWDGVEKFYNYAEWLLYLVDHFMKPWGYILNGEIQWCGEQNDDMGAIYVKDNNIEVYDSEIVTQRPSWEK